MAVSDLQEISSDTSAEEIAAYAEQVAKEVEQERKGEEKSDAQITSEQAEAPQPSDKPVKDAKQPKTPKTPVENNSDRDSAVDDGEETGDIPESPEWLTDEVKAEATAYGIDESEIADFASREELDRALRLFDKTALEAGRKALAESDGDTTRNDKGQFVKKEATKAAEQAPKKSGRFEVTLSKEEYDDAIVDHITGMRDHYESRLEALESHFEEASASAEEQRFDSFVDSLGHTDLFGTTGKESDKELERRRDLNVAVKAQLIGLEKLGRPAEMSQQLISRVANMTFGEELGKKRLKQQTAKISKQSQLRQGGSPTKPLPPRDDPRDEADRLYKELSQS